MIYIITIIILFALIHGTMVYSRYNLLNLENKYALKCFVSNIPAFANALEYPMSIYSYAIPCYLIFPFLSDKTICYKSGGSLYGFYIYDLYPELSKKLDNKLFWADVFAKNNINHPLSIAYKINHKINILSQYNNSTYYILKPINGTLGHGVKKIKGCDIKKTLSKTDKDILVQEIINDCTSAKTRHFRYVTFYDGKVFCIKEFANKEGSVTSNIHTGGISTHFNINTIQSTAKQPLNEMFGKLSNLHKNSFPMIFSIGWDVMIDCSRKNIRAICLEGNICHGSWNKNPDNKDKKLIKIYLTKHRNFIKKNLFVEL